MEEVYYSIQSAQGFWQCGAWVRNIFNATKYPSVSEAQAAMAMRNLSNSIVVENHEQWRDLRGKEHIKNETPTKEGSLV